MAEVRRDWPLGPVSNALSQGDYLPGLDGIRALAISLVLFSHSVIHDQFRWLAGAGLLAGEAGVIVFFVLSGYLITGLLLREETETGSISLPLFYLRRALRLFPALWVYLLVVFGLWLGDRLPHHPLHSFVTSLFYFRNLVGHGHETDHLWSLSVEEQFYLLWPIAFIGLQRQDRTRLLIAGSLVALVTLWRIYAARNDVAPIGALHTRSDFRLDSPLLGCALALAEKTAPGAIALFNGAAWRSNTLLLISSSGLALVLLIGFKRPDIAYPGTGPAILGLLGVGLVLSQVGVHGRVSGLLTWRPLTWLGRMSYGIYLWQQLFLGPRSSGFEIVRTFPIGLFVSITAAWLSFRWLERPVLRLKNRKFARINQAAALSNGTG